MIEPYMGFFFAAKNDLNGDANEAGIIPWTAIHLYAQTYGLDIEEFERLVMLIRAMEDGIREETEKDKPKETGNTPTVPDMPKTAGAFKKPMVKMGKR